MQVQHRVQLDERHSVEFGLSTWDEACLSVRNRYDRADGGFSPHGSSELPLDDLPLLIIEASRRQLFDVASIARMIVALAASLPSQSPDASQSE